MQVYLRKSAVALPFMNRYLWFESKLFFSIKPKNHWFKIDYNTTADDSRKLINWSLEISFFLPFFWRDVLLTSLKLPVNLLSLMLKLIIRYNGALTASVSSLNIFNRVLVTPGTIFFSSFVAWQIFSVDIGFRRKSKSLPSVIKSFFAGGF